VPTGLLRGRPWSWRRLGPLLALLLAMGAVAGAQRFNGFSRNRLPFATLASFDGGFQYCRAAYRGNPAGYGGGWLTDYPDADHNLSVRFGELTKTHVSTNPQTGDPKNLIVQLTGPELFRCPMIMMFEVGNLYLDDVDAAALRTYLLKGGFLWVDDFWGERAWAVFESQIRKVFPSGRYPIVDLELDHPIFHQFQTVNRIPQIPSINYWMGSGGDTSERGPDSRVPHIRAINDERGRIMVLMSHNTDFGDSYEREGVNHEYFLTFSVPGYAFGINALIYALSH
jgi:hypothetical protein